MYRINPEQDMSKSIAGVLYITYDGLCDPLGQSQVVPYLVALSEKKVKIFVLSFEKKARLKDNVLLQETKALLKHKNIVWMCLRYHKNPCLLATLYDVFLGYLAGLFLIGKYRINIAHARGYVPAFIAACLRKVTRVKFVFDMRGFWAEEKIDSGFWKKESLGYKLTKNCEIKMLAASDIIIVLTNKAKAVLAHSLRIGEEKVEVIPTCIDTASFTPLAGQKKTFLKGRIVILYSGSTGTFYGFNEALDLFMALYSKEKRAFFLALVNNHNEIIKERLKIASIPGDSYRVMSLPYRQMPEWVREADLTLIFYRRNNSYAGCCPTKLGESLACGVPVIINKNIGDCEDILQKERIGFILEDFKDTAFKKISNDFLDSLKARDNMRIRCRNVAENLFSLDTGVNKYLAIYKRLV